MRERRSTYGLLLLALAACDVGSVGAFESTGTTGGAEGSGDGSSSTSSGADDPTTRGVTSTPETEGTTGATSGEVPDSSSSTNSGSDGSTGGTRACANGTELKGLEDTCVSAPTIVDPAPAYDVVSIYSNFGLAVANDNGVARYRLQGGSVQLAETVELPAAARHLATVSLGQRDSEGEREVRQFLLATVPDADRLALIGTDDAGALSLIALLETGLHPTGIGCFYLSEVITCTTANEGDGTLSLFTQVGIDTMVPAGTWAIGGAPRSIIPNHWGGNVGVLDTNVSALRILRLEDVDGEFEFAGVDTYPLRAEPVWAGLFGSDYYRMYGVLSRDEGTLTFLDPDNGAELFTEEFSGGPSQVVNTQATLWPSSALDSSVFWTGLILQTDASSITVGIHGNGEGGPEFDRVFGSFSTAEHPAALTVYDANGDSRRDFVTASPTSGLAVVYQQQSSFP